MYLQNKKCPKTLIHMATVHVWRAELTILEECTGDLLGRGLVLVLISQSDSWYGSH